MDTNEVIMELLKKVIVTPAGKCPSCQPDTIISGFHTHDADEHYLFYNKGISDAINVVSLSSKEVKEYPESKQEPKGEK